MEIGLAFCWPSRGAAEKRLHARMRQAKKREPAGLTARRSGSGIMAVLQELESEPGITLYGVGAPDRSRDRAAASVVRASPLDGKRATSACASTSD